VTLGTGRDAFCEDAEDDYLSIGLEWRDGPQASWSFRYDRSADPDEPLRVYADPAGHPFCVFVD